MVPLSRPSISVSLIKRPVKGLNNQKLYSKPRPPICQLADERPEKQEANTKKGGDSDQQ